MLHSKLLARALAGLAAAWITGAAAQGLPSGATGTPLSPVERAKFEALTRDLQQAAQRGLQDPQQQQQAADMVRHVDEIANPQMAAEREKVLRFLGINPRSTHALYIFLSWSMPVEMLRAYAIEAMWTGAIVVFRGVPPGRSLPDFLVKDLRQLVWDQGASATLSLDPRLFEAYRVSIVPTIVLTRTRDNYMCAGAGTRVVHVGGQTASYSLCPPVTDNQYIKLSGAVTLDYALKTFQEQGRHEADMYLSALQRAYGAGQAATRLQQPFRGEWKDAFTPQRLIQQGERNREPKP
jgi:type-F conjugative transfer system pilin assembly protein TrbC